MSQFPEIRHALSAIFSIQTGLSDESASAMFRRALDSQDWRRRLEAELITAISSARTPWKALMCNEDYEVFEPESDAEARSFLATILWEPTFPDRAVPLSS
jgi:hypothetical protein